MALLSPAAASPGAQGIPMVEDASGDLIAFDSDGAPFDIILLQTRCAIRGASYLGGAVMHSELPGRYRFSWLNLCAY
jgi:hypothetical protein